MEDYFNHVVNNLGIDEMTILGVLQQMDADKPFKALKRNTLIEGSNLTVANFRKSLTKLEALSMVIVDARNKENLIHITEFGVEALNKNLEGVVEE